MSATPATQQADISSSSRPSLFRPISSRSLLLGLMGVVLLLTGCWVDVEVEVTVDSDGSGRVVANVLFSQELTDALISRGGDSGTIGIDFADFEANGWEVSPDSTSTQRQGEIVQVLTLTKEFVSPEHLKTILEDDLQLGLEEVSLVRDVSGSSVDYQLTGRFNQGLLAFVADAARSGDAAGAGDVDLGSLQRAPRVTLTVNMPGGDQSSGDQTSVNQTSVVLGDGGDTSFEFATSTNNSGSRIWLWVGWAAAALLVFVILMNLVGYLIEKRQRRSTASTQLSLDLNNSDSSGAEPVSITETPITETPIADTPIIETPADETPIVETPTDGTIADSASGDSSSDDSFESPNQSEPLLLEVYDETVQDETAQGETAQKDEIVTSEETNDPMPQLNSINLPSGTSAVTCITEDAERALVIIPDIMGLRQIFEEHTIRLAQENNWNVCCFELYAENPDYKLDERFAHACELEDDRVLGDAIAAADIVSQEANIPVGIIGFCMGGMYVNKSVPIERFDRAVSFYGMIEVPEAWQSDTQREPLECLAEGDPSKLLAIIAEDDDYTPADEVAKLRETDVQVISYSNCDHGFVHDPNRESHRPTEAAEAWQISIAFLKGEQ